MIKLSLYWLLSLGLTHLMLVGCKKLPPLWKEDDIDLKSYRIMAEVEVTESGKIFMLEEWTSLTKRLFRLDLIDSYSGVRRTLLSNRYTNENFHFQPFECSLVSNFKKAFFPELADKFESNFDLAAPTGIGSLWLQSSEVDAGYLRSSFNDLSKIHIKTANVVLKNYIEYEVPTNGNGYPYRLDFYFRPGVENLKSLALIHVLKTEEISKVSVVMRIKILEVETFTQAIDSFNDFEGVFDLPVGYGCQRGEFYDRSFAVPVNSFMPNYVPHILQLDIISTQPVDLDHDTDKWKTHQVSVRIVKGRLKLDYTDSNDYIILETQDFALRSPTISVPISSGNNSKKVASLRRSKRVWDLGRDGLTSKDSEKRAKFFEIDERTRQCLDFGENKLSESVSIEFGISTNKESNTDGEKTKTILNLNTELIDTLFTSTQDYHMIGESRLKSHPSLREAIHERRVNKFQLKDNKGDVVWSGPVSFIRKHSTKLKSDILRQTSSSIYFYSDDLTRLIGKIHMAVVERRTISETYLHRELEDIGKICFVKMLINDQENGLLPYQRDKITSSETSLNFELSYPIESKDAAETLAMSDSIEEIIYKEYIRSMFAVSNGRLNMLQISDIDIDFGPEMIKISGEISEMPMLLNYWQDYGQKFSESKQHLLFNEKNIETEEACAKSCLNCNCYMFSYCSKSKQCDILLTKLENSNKQQRGSVVMTFEPDSSCSVFKPRIYPDNSTIISAKTFIKPNEFVQKLREIVLASKGDDKSNALKLELKYISATQEKLEIILSPLFLRSGQFISQEFNDLLGEGGNGEKVTDNNQVKAEYKIIFENRKYKDSLKVSQDFPIQLAQHTSYNDCKSLCSETDCRSFSHCKIESICRVSMLHKLKQIRDSSEDEELCIISQREYMSKFRQISDDHVLKLRKISKTTMAGSANDCASDCMEEEKFKCKSFYYCQNKQENKKSGGNTDDNEGAHESGQEFTCYLRKTHLFLTDQKPLMKNKTSHQVQQRECHLYTRSYLVDFDKFYGLSLSEIIGDNGKDISEIIHNSSAEECAIECANRDGKCQAFEVCRSDTSHEPTCTFLTKSVASKEMPALDALLVGDDRCTSFLISAKSELNKFGDLENLESDEDELSIGNIETHSVETSHWFMKLILFSIGLSLGYLVTVIIIRRRSRSS